MSRVQQVFKAALDSLIPRLPTGALFRTAYAAHDTGKNRAMSDVANMNEVSMCVRRHVYIIVIPLEPGQRQQTTPSSGAGSTRDPLLREIQLHPQHSANH